MAEPMLRVTLVPTMIQAAPADNMIPAKSPRSSSTAASRRAWARSTSASRSQTVLGAQDPSLEIEFDDKTIGNESPYETELADAIREWLAEVDPEATLVPTVMPGFSDSHWFRKAFGSTVVYGFHPQRELDMLTAAPLVHGADECAAVVRRRACGRLLRMAGAAGCWDERPRWHAAAGEARGGRGQSQAEQLRLGGMALRNGLLVHGPTHWAVAVRNKAGEIEVASGAKPSVRPRAPRHDADGARPAQARRGARRRPPRPHAPALGPAAVRGPDA